MTTVAEVMLDAPKVTPATATVGELREAFATDDHVQVALLVDGAGVLVAVVHRADLPGHPDPADAADPAALAASYGSLDGLVVRPDAEVEPVQAAMAADGSRRMAVTDADGRLVGLLARKRSGRGWCSGRPPVE